MSEPRKTVAVDLDGVLADFSRGFVDIHTIGDPIPGAVEFTRRLSQFADVLIWTTRCNPEIGRGMGATLLRNIVRDWLDRHGFAYADIWTGPAKPIAAAFIDDRAVSCRPQPANPQAAFDAALYFARALCEHVPPGCSLSHSTPVLASRDWLAAKADEEERAGAISAGTPQPFGKAEELEALRARIAVLERQVAEAEESAVYASRAVATLDAAVESSRDRAEKAEGRAVRLSAALNGLLDAVNNLSDDAREEFGGPDDAPVRAAIDALGLIPNSGEEPTR